VAAVKLKERGWIKPDEKVLLLNTGSGIKYPDTVDISVPTLQPEENLQVNN
jgi:threonine synthase